MSKIIKYNPWKIPKKKSYIETIRVGTIPVGYRWKKYSTYKANVVKIENKITTFYRKEKY